ncbi:uncharacterized protein [Chironomus tepperi]|uniref:uncharacterized protein n=1 Tax=Chironomus tepperi TaxID=113505 RepID=UPI00391F5382
MKFLVVVALLAVTVCGLPVEDVEQKQEIEGVPLTDAARLKRQPDEGVKEIQEIKAGSLDVVELEAKISADYAARQKRHGHQTVVYDYGHTHYGHHHHAVPHHHHYTIYDPYNPGNHHHITLYHEH